MEKIISIEEITNLRLGNTGRMLNALADYGEYDGYKITTEKTEYLILIHNYQYCCESWGYFISEDDTNDYIGKDLIEVALTDKALNNKKLE